MGLWICFWTRPCYAQQSAETDDDAAADLASQRVPEIADADQAHMVPWVRVAAAA